MKNKANLNSLNLTLNSCSRVVYNVFRPKTQNGTKPNKANLKPISKWRTPRFSSETQEKNFFMESKANFFTTPNPNFSAELFSDTRLRQEPPAGCKNGDWLVPAEGRVVPVPFFATAVQRSSRQKKPLRSPRGENAIMRNEPNFNREASTLTHEITKDYNKLPCNGRRKNEPKTNPIRTQYGPNSNPIRTQYEPNPNPIS